MLVHLSICGQFVFSLMVVYSENRSLIFFVFMKLGNVVDLHVYVKISTLKSSMMIVGMS